MYRLISSTFVSLAVVVLLLGTSSWSAFAQKMHRWVDEDGQVHFSQTPPPNQDMQESEVVSYGEEKKNNVDRACCEQVRGFARTASSYLQRGLTVMDIQAEFPPSEYPYLTEVVNHISLDASSGDSPAAIGSRAFRACMNRSFQACRVESRPSLSDGSTVDSSGSGVLIGNGFVVTNDHVVDGCSEITVSAAQVKGNLRARDSGTDLAIIEAQLEGRAPVAMTSVERPRLGQDIVVAGYPLSSVLESLNLTTGTVSSESAIKGSSTLFQITAPIQPGNSGGPVLDSSGRLIGIVVSRLADIPVLKTYSSIPQNVNFAITPMAVKTFLREHNIPFRTARSESEIGTEAIAEQAKRHTVRVFCYR